MENTSVTLPNDMIIEILLRMPLKSLVKCTCASKKLASLIRTKEFRDPYLVRSMKMPRLLFIVSDLFIVHYPETDVLFHSVYQEEKPLLSSGQQQTRIPLYQWNISHPIRGLICIQEATKVRISNLGAKKLHTLPKIQAQLRSIQGYKYDKELRSFFGCDKEGNVFKVLCMTKSDLDESEASKEHQVLTVGLGEEAWRPIICEHHHCPLTQGLCKDGVVYYGARSKSGKYVVMSFNVNSEEFTVIELPEGVNIREHYSKLVNYNGNIALVDDSDFDFRIVNELNGNGVFEMWVRNNEVEGTWSKKHIEIPHWKENVGTGEIFFKGTIGTGELVFAPYFGRTGSFRVLYYNTATKEFRECKIEGVDFREGVLQQVQTLLDHVDSPWLV